MSKFKTGDTVKFITFDNNNRFFSDNGKGIYIVEHGNTGESCTVHDNKRINITWNVSDRELELATVKSWKQKLED